MVGRFVSLLLSQSAGQVDFGLDQALIPVKLWDRGGDNQFRITGTLVVGGRPVGGVRIGLNAYTLPTPTGADGTFTLQGDRTVLSRLRLHVVDTSGAMVEGQPSVAADSDALGKAETVIETAFPITLDAGQTVGPGASLSGRITFADSTSPAPQVALWGYELQGVIQDGAGAPIPGAYVSISDDEGETWAVSGASGDDGRYSLRFFPTGGGEYNIRVSIGEGFYESGSAVSFGAGGSAQLDVVADPMQGMVMGTGAGGAFEVTDIPGAEYVGYLVGVASGDTPVDAGLTWPDAQGAFTVTLPDPLPDGDLSFFQMRLRFFTEADVAPGSPIPAGVIPSTLDELTPRNLPPALTRP